MRQFKDGPETNNRNLNQYWIYWARESAAKGYKRSLNMTFPDQDGNVYDDAYNLTMTNRRDSDIKLHQTVNDAIRNSRFNFSTRWCPDSHGYGTKLESDQFHLTRLLSNKFKFNETDSGDKARKGNFVTWVVSNCNKTLGAKQRFDYAQELIQNGLKLDGYGKCFDKEITNLKKADGLQKMLLALSKYKFYLAFENGIHCKDYLSEKFWRNSLEAELVPIVFGTHPQDVKELAPPNSYIHVEDFKGSNGSKDLVDYLNYLNENDTAYMEYHQWRINIKPDLSKPLYGIEEKKDCGTCQLLKEKRKQNYPKRMIRSVCSWWWLNTHDDLCINMTAMPEYFRNIYPPVSMSDNYFEEFRLGFFGRMMRFVRRYLF